MKPRVTTDSLGDSPAAISRRRQLSPRPHTKAPPRTEFPSRRSRTQVACADAVTVKARTARGRGNVRQLGRPLVFPAPRPISATSG